MHPTRPHSINDLSGHASLLLSASPTIISSSPLQNNTNNTSTSSNIINAPSSINNTTATTTTTTATTTATATATTNSDSANNTSSRASCCSDDELPEDNDINFKKPQSEIFRKLDGRIQRIVAAHSNLNKLYALNDFSSVGPRKPFELPPPLPRPPPWIPKVSNDYGCSQWAEETLNNLNRVANEDLDNNMMRQSSSIPGPQRVTRVPKGNIMPLTKPPTPTIDSAISRLHQRRQQQQQQQHQNQNQNQNQNQQQQQQPQPQPQPQPQQQQQQQQQNQFQHKFQVPQAQPRISQQAQKIHQLDIKPVPMNHSQQQQQSVARSLFPSSSRSNQNLAQFNSKGLDTLNALIQVQRQQLRQTRQQDQQNNPQPTDSTGLPRPAKNLSPEAKRKFQTELINIFRQEIAAVTKLAKLQFQSPQQSERPRTAEQKSLLLKKSPQSLFNTIRRETSLLLNRREPNRAGVSILSEQQSGGRPAQFSHSLHSIYRPVVKRYNTVKVVVPPTEYFKHVCGKQPSGKGNSENIQCNCLESKAQISNVDDWCPPRQFSISYRSLQAKLYQLKYIQRRDELNRKRGICVSMLPADARKSKPKSLDKIVDRLQARCLTSSTSPVNQGSQATDPSPPSSPKPIPVFCGAPGKGGYLPGDGSLLSSGPSRLTSLKMKKAKRLHHFGLRLNNYLDKDHPQPSTEKITVEQFARGLNLVRSNDASLRRHQEKLMQSEMKWKVPTSDRPMRLRRIHGEKMRMPASASYRATRKVGLQ